MFQKTMRRNGSIISAQKYCISWLWRFNWWSMPCHFCCAQHHWLECCPYFSQDPPQIPPSPLGSFICTPFNETPSVVSFERDDKAFGSSIIDDVILRWLYLSPRPVELWQSPVLHMPSKVTQKNLQEVNCNYRGPLRQSLMVIESGMLVHCEPLGLCSDCFTKLRIVPPSLRTAIFVCFHTYLNRGHLNAHQTQSRLRMRFYWPRMFTHCARCFRQCPGVRLQT